MSQQDIVTGDGLSFFVDATGLLYKIEKTGQIFPSTITLPPNVRLICENLFCNNHGITQIVLNDGLREIGKYSFIDCQNLSSVIMPHSLRTIGESAFRNCYRLKTVNLNEGLERIGDLAFKRTSIERIEIPRSVQRIGDLCFTKCKSLRNVSIANEDITLGNMMFNGDINLQTVDCPEKLKRKVRLEMLNV